MNSPVKKRPTKAFHQTPISQRGMALAWPIMLVCMTLVAVIGGCGDKGSQAISSVIEIADIASKVVSSEVTPISPSHPSRNVEGSLVTQAMSATGEFASANRLSFTSANDSIDADADNQGSQRNANRDWSRNFFQPPAIEVVAEQAPITPLMSEVRLLGFIKDWTDNTEPRKAILQRGTQTIVMPAGGIINELRLVSINETANSVTLSHRDETWDATLPQQSTVASVSTTPRSTSASKSPQRDSKTWEMPAIPKLPNISRAQDMPSFDLPSLLHPSNDK